MCFLPNWISSLRSITSGKWKIFRAYYTDVIMDAMASQVIGISIIYPTVCSGTDQRKHQSSASLAFVRGIHGWPVNSPHKGPVTQKMFSFDGVIMCYLTDSTISASEGWCWISLANILLADNFIRSLEIYSWFCFTSFCLGDQWFWQCS